MLTSGNSDVSPDVSPAGGMIVFQRCRFAINCDDIGGDNVWIMRADGSHQRPLTHCDGSVCLGAFTPAFSPDGRTIAFEEDLLDAHGVNVNGIFLMRTDGTDVRRVTSTGPDGLPDSQPEFSPDGRRLVFERELPDGNQVMTVRVDGTGLRPLLPGVQGFSPHWSPDGRLIVFTIARRTGGATTLDIATVRPDGSRLRLLTHSTADGPAFTPDFSPAQDRVVYSQADSDGCHLVIAGLRGHGAQILTAGSGCVVEPSWAGAKS